MRGLHKIAKILLGAIFLIFGTGHLMDVAGLAGNVPSYIPGGSIWVIITGIVFILGGLSILANRWTNLFASLVAAQLVLFALLVHAPLASANQLSLVMLLKDLGLASGALLLARN